MSSSFLAIFIRLKEQSFDSTLELDSEGAILSKPFPAPDGSWGSEALLSSESVPGGALQCRGESYMWSFESICHVKPGVG